MYSVTDYGRMLADPVRVDAYRRALSAAIEPGDVVIDLGAGTGFFALEACRLGASKVYAIETNDAIALLPALARQYGYADRIEVIQRPSSEVSLERKADVLVADLRGVSPLYHANFAVMADAKARLLAPDGIMIPQRDHLCATLVTATELYETVVGGWSREPFPMAEARRLSVNAFHSDRESPLGRDADIAPPTAWAQLVYGEAPPELVTGAVEIAATRDSIAHGVALSFEAVLSDGARFSSAEIARVYSRGFLPLEQPVSLRRDDSIRVELAARRGMGDHIWAWSTTVRRGSAVEASFRQSTFLGQVLSRESLHKELEGYVPLAGARARAIAAILVGMDGRTPIESLAKAAHDAHPGAFVSAQEAIVQARQIMRKYG